MNPLELIAQKKMEAENPLAVMHLSMCAAVGGWVPVEEFMEMPLQVPADIIELYSRQMKEIDKRSKHG